jgi:MYXO-CTERM domain-containing protein
VKRLLLLVAVALAMPASAQTYSCGDIQLVFRNPDLQPREDGYIHAQGQFFIQFQAIGPEADKIKVFGFSFGPYTTEVDQGACSQPVWFTGTYVLNYRADRDPADGFFIPIKTPLVPDGVYAAAVHAYDESNNELARFWGRAIVDNCDTQPTPVQERCGNDAAQMTAHDKTAPWPIVLPGDGAPLEGKTLSIEFGEPLANFTVLLNGEDITAQFAEWPGRIWDADNFPDYGPGGLNSVVAAPCSQPYHTCEKYGPAYEWNGRALTDQDVLRIVAIDLAGNRAVKDIHIGSSVASGAVTQQAPILSYTVDRQEQTAEPGDSIVFGFRISNNGGGTGHPFAQATAPQGWGVEWQPAHVVVEPGQTQAQELVVEVPAGALPGRYQVNATLKYSAGGQEKVLAQPLAVIVDAVPMGVPGPAATTTDEGKDTPGVGVVALLLALALVAARRRA